MINKGIFWKVVSCTAFAISHGIARYLSGRSPINPLQAIDIYQIMFFQNIIAAILLYPATIYSSRIKHKSDFIFCLRLLIAALGTTLWYISITLMPIAEVVALGFLAPILTMLLSIVILKEQLNNSRLFSILLSSIGIYFISYDNFTVNLQYISLPVLAMLLFSLDKIFVRKLALNNYTASRMSFALLAFMSIFFLVICYYNKQQLPKISNSYWLYFSGVATAIAHYAFSKALTHAEVLYLIPISSIKLLLAILVGYIAFSEVPQNGIQWLGMLLIFICPYILLLNTGSNSKQLGYNKL